MDSAELLDLLGNANRRRILRLLSRKPCYVTEISEYLGVSPKAVIDHLRKLEAANLVESRVDDQRRKYFYISRGFRLEVSVSPYDFGTKSAYPASSGLDLTSCRYLTIDMEPGGTADLSELTADLAQLKQLRDELSLAQRWVQGRLTDVMEEIADRIEGGDARLTVEILLVLADRTTDTTEVSHRVDAPPSVVEEILAALRAEGLVEQTDAGWTISD